MSKNKFQSTKNIGMGILQGLESMDDISIKNDEKKEDIKVVKNKKSKRSFMLKDSQIEKLYELKFKYIHQDLSDIVGLAIDEFHEKYKDK